MSEKVRLQELRDFTVQIRVAGTGAIVGTGVVVSMDGQVVTCAHVVKAAIGAHPRQAGGAEVGVYFPQARGGEVKERRATVAACFPQHDDDVVLLQLAGGPAPLGPEQIAVLGRAEDSCYHPFRSYGFRRLDRYVAGHAHGTILGCVLPPQGQDVLAEPVQLESSQINLGMSGAGVLDMERNLVVGIVSETWFPDLSTKDRDTAWAVNARVLSLAPLGLPLRDVPLAKRPAPQPKTDVAAARAAVAAEPGVAWNNAPPPLEEWVGRADLLEAIDRDWADPQRRVSGLIGFGGEGKSSLARRWVEDLLAAPAGPPFAPYRPQSGGGDADCGPRRAMMERGDADGGPRQAMMGRGDADGGPRQAMMGRGDADCGPRQATMGRGDADCGPRRAIGERPDGVFWWGFYTRPSVDEFFEAALDYLSGGRVDPRSLPSSGAKAAFIAGMLTAGGRYLFVLDGLEVMQRQEGDRYGLLRSADLRDFLRYLAAAGHESFGLVTSRAPLLDLMAYTSYIHRDVGRLFPGDGRALLRRAGVRGPDAALDKVVADWDGHALTLSLIGAHLASQYGGEVARAGEIDPPTAGEPRYERVHRVLRRYDEHLDQAERAFLTLFSAFRTAVPVPALEKVFRAGGGEATLPVERKPGLGERARVEKPGFYAIAALDDAAFAAMVQRLVGYRILRHDAREGTYTTHPLVRNHYYARLIEGGEARARAAHERIQEYYLELAGDAPRAPSLDDLAPLIEVVHHACCAGACDEADQIYWDRIQQRQRGVLVYQLGAWETDLALLSEFFPGGDRRWILNEAGLCLVSLGRLGEVATFYERGNAIALQRKDWRNASVIYRNLAELHAHLGALEASAQAAGEALALARRAENKRDECHSLARQAWAAHLRGDLAAAGAAFREAEALEREIDWSKRYLYSRRGIRHADHLRRAGDVAYARRVAEANLEICEQYRVIKDVSLCHRVMGDLEADAGRHGDAGAHYRRALEIARGITFRPALIEALLARGRWAAWHLQDPPAAFGDLEEALGYAVEGGYRVYEADARAALAWAHLAAGDAGAADERGDGVWVGEGE